MSRVYSVRVSEGVTHRVHVEDGIEANLGLLGVLGRERMSALLADELTGRGWTVADGKATKEMEGGVVVEIDTQTGGISIKAVHSEDLQLEVEVQGQIDEDFEESGRARLRERAQQELAAQARAADAKATEQATAHLEAALAAVQPELDQITNAVTRTALVERARQLGSVTEVTEGPNGDMTIRVRV